MLTTAILSTATAALYGCADFLGGLSSRRESAFIVTANAHLLGLLLLSSASLVFRAELVTRTDLAWGSFSGVSGGIGVLALYAALASGRMSVVAPITAALSGSLPAVYDLATGAEVGPRALFGLALAVAAIVVVSASGDEHDEHRMPRSAIALSVVAGCGFAGSFLGFHMAGEASGLWPLVSARATSTVMLGFFAWVRLRRYVPDASVRWSTFGAGALDATANVTMISAIRSGPLAVASVIGSLYPVATVLLARFVLDERTSVAQRIGIAVAFAAVVMTAIP
jgi:drug/metabolite transporter (DMT)-like permease